MTAWRTVPLGTALELAYGKALPKTARVETGNVPVYGSNGIAGWHDEALVNESTVIVGRKGSAGAVQYVEGPCFPIDTTYFARPRSGFQFDTKFVFYLLRWLDLSRLKTATGVPGLTREDAYRESIPVPPIDEQRRIVDLLWRAEGIVRLRREAQKKTAEIIPALFLDMFGDPATNPKGWPTEPLGDHVDLLTGFAFKSSEFVAERESVKLCRGANVLPQRMDWSDVRYWPNERVDDYRQFMLAEGDIVLAMDRPWISEGLKVARMTKNDVPALLVQRVARIRPKNTLLYEYVYATLCHERFTAHCNAVKTETLVPHISPHDIRSFPLVLAPIDQQQRFASVVQQVQSIASQQREGLAKAEATFNALLGQVFPVADGSTTSEQELDAASA